MWVWVHEDEAGGYSEVELESRERRETEAQVSSPKSSKSSAQICRPVFWRCLGS